MRVLERELDEGRMYERVVDVPRLLAFYGEADSLPDPQLVTARDALSGHYADELREPFRTAGLCLYRGGSDSVAWHGDTIGRGRAARTRSSPSCRWAPPGTSCCGPAAAVPSSATVSVTAT